MGGCWSTELAGSGCGLGGRPVVVVYSVVVLVLLACVHSPLWRYGGAWWPECQGPVQWGLQVVLNSVVLVVGVCRLRATPWHWWDRW